MARTKNIGPPEHRPRMRVCRCGVRYDARHSPGGWCSQCCAERIASGRVVYFIATDDLLFVKIGWTDNIKSRLATLQMANPRRLFVLRTIPGGEELERRLHRRFQKLRIRGEWFHLTAEVAESANDTDVPNLTQG